MNRGPFRRDPVTRVGHMAYDIIIRSQQSRDPRLEYAKTSVEPDAPLAARDRPPAATNDNDVAWPLIPFPEGWYGA